ncbi:MAG: hypothetical protein R6W81_05770 [Bacteroidales bacterium]
MPELTPREIDRISRDIARQEIIFSHLLEDLIDHVCCDVESEMISGIPFSEAYRKVKEKMGNRRLKEIQEETLYAVDTKYRKMKKTMKISGVAGTIMLSLSALLKILHIPPAGALLTLGAITLALLFLPSALVVLWKETHNTRKLFLFIITFLAGSSWIVGILFKIQHWPGAALLITLSLATVLLLLIPILLISKLREKENPEKIPVYATGTFGLVLYFAGFLFRINHWPLAGLLMSAGALIIFLVVFPWYVWLTWREEKNITVKFLFMVIACLVVALPTTLLNMGVQQSYEGGFYTHQYQQEALYNYQRERNNAEALVYHYMVTDTGIRELHIRTNELLAIVNEMEAEMVRIAEGEPGRPVQNPLQLVSDGVSTRIRYFNLSRPFHPSPYALVAAPGTEPRQKLDGVMKDYVEFLTGIAGSENMPLIGPLLDYSSWFPSMMVKNDDIALMPALHALTLLKNRILLSEIIAIKIITMPQ